MSAALYGRDSTGVTRQIKKLYANVGGVTRELKELWARDGSGVNRKIFSSAITWTYRWFTESGTPDYYSISDTVSVQLRMNGYGSSRGGYEFIFPEPILLPAGTTITADMYMNNYGMCYYYVSLEDDEVISDHIQQGNGSPKNQVYTVPTDIIVPYISCDLYVQSSSGNFSSGSMAVTIDLQDGNPFLLNDSGSSN